MSRIIDSKFLSILAMIGLFVLSACGSSENMDKTNKASEPVKLTIGYLNVMDDAQVMLAEDAGIYEKYGLDVELKLFSSGTDLIKGIVGGQLDAGVLGFSNAVSWAGQGADLKVVSGAQMGYHSLLARSDSGIESVADLKGKNLGTQKQGSTADLVLNGVMLKEVGLVRSDVNMVYVSPSVAVQSLAAGKVDAAFLFEPYDRIARLTADVKPIYEIGDVWPFPCMVTITSGETLNDKRDIINKVLDAQKEAIEMLENEPEKSAELLAARFIEGESIDTPNGPVKAVDIITDAIKAQTFTWELNESDVARMQELADIMIEQGSLKEPIDVTTIVDLTWQESLGK
jgi:NitT/TauT family transport system substrate-binding protein